jgi:hypothetical protein
MWCSILSTSRGELSSSSSSAKLEQPKHQGSGNNRPASRGLSRHPTFAVGHPSCLSRHPSSLLGHPSRLLGRPSCLSGYPSCLPEHPSRLSKLPSCLSRHPSCLSGHPSSLSGHPKVDAGPLCVDSELVVRVLAALLSSCGSGHRRVVSACGHPIVIVGHVSTETEFPSCLSKHSGSLFLSLRAADVRVSAQPGTANFSWVSEVVSCLCKEGSFPLLVAANSS